jgi:hypothetical protein
MATVHKQFALKKDLVYLLILSAMIGVVFAFNTNKKSNVQISFAVPASEEAQLIPTPTQVFVPNIERFTQVSPDGTKTLTLTITNNKDLSKSFVVTNVDTSSNKEDQVFTGTLARTENITIPFNTWSPDNRYIFLEQRGATHSGELVMNASGKPLPNGEPFQNVTDLYNARNTGNIYQETTGWASETLLIINTLKDGEKGPSYWFETPSKAIIQLSTRF